MAHWKLRSEIEVSPFPFTISHLRPLCLLGSCFSQNMGQVLSHHLFPTVVNPHGTVFNPVSILETIKSTFLSSCQHLAPFVAQRDGLYFNYKYHSSIHANTWTQYEQALQIQNLELAKAITQSQAIAITYGSAWVHQLADSREVVANCHKMPGQLFEKSLLGLDKTAAAIEETVALLTQANPTVNIILTVSPVRHLSYGFAANHLGKAVLQLAVHRVINNNPNTHYFPAYELLMDDLRDYRFYAHDLIHPNELAIQYIWEKFGDAFFDLNTKKANSLIEKLQAAKNHRPIAQPSDSVAKFKGHNLALCADIEQLTRIDMSQHRDFFAT